MGFGELGRERRRTGSRRMDNQNAESRGRPARVAYLLADAGVAIGESEKGCSIHARSMIQAFQAESSPVDVYALRRGKDRTHDHVGEAAIQRVRSSMLSRLWRQGLIHEQRWRRLWPFAPDESATPRWISAVATLLRQRDFLRHVRGACRAHRPDVLYARHAWLAYPYACLRRRTGAPLVLEVNAVTGVEKAARGEMVFERLARAIERGALQAADRILVVSEQLREQVVRIGGDPRKIALAPNAVDPALFRPAERRPENSRSEFRIGAVCSMRPYHGVGTLLRSAAAIRSETPGLRLRLIGGGPELEAMRALARQLGIAEVTEFTGTVEHPRVAGLLQDCDVCAAPYEGDENQYGCPMKLYEYMAVGTPIVASSWGDVTNILGHGRTALLHEPGSVESLAGALLEVYRDPDSARGRARLAREEVAAKHTWRKRARDILAWRANLQ